MPPLKATKTKKPLKILAYGASGVGKTHLALHATPGKTLVFDMEGGTDLYGGFVEFDFWVDDNGQKTQSYRELRKCIDYLKAPQGLKNYETFIVDPITLLWTLLQQERQDYKEGKVKVQKINETDLESFTTRDWNIVKKMHKAVIDELCALPQNVILIAREKEITEMKANGEPIRTGEYTYEGEKGVIYAVDYAFRLTVDKHEKRKAVITKVRLPNAPIKKGDVIDNPTFQMFREITDRLKDGEQNKTVSTQAEGLFDDNKVPTTQQKPRQQTLKPEPQPTAGDKELEITLGNYQQPEPTTSGKALADKPRKALHAIRNELGLNEAQFKQLLSDTCLPKIAEEFGFSPFKVNSLNDLAILDDLVIETIIKGLNAVAKQHKQTNGGLGQTVCANCNNPISDKVFKFSSDRFGKGLCMDCQKSAQQGAR